MKTIIGAEYGRGCLRTAISDGPALGPAAIQKMFPNDNWIMVPADAFDADACAKDRFGENFQYQKKLCAQTPATRHIMIGGDHSVNYGHFVALANQLNTPDLCLVYIDAHLDIHTPESAKAQASGAPHGTNVRALLGDGDTRWLTLQKTSPVLKPENVFYLGTRSYEPAEIEFVKQNNIYFRTPSELVNDTDVAKIATEIRNKIGDHPYVVSFDFDAIDPKYFHDVLVPAGGGMSPLAAIQILNVFNDAHSYEFVEYAPTGDDTSAQIAYDLVKTALSNMTDSDK